MVKRHKILRKRCAFSWKRVLPHEEMEELDSGVCGCVDVRADVRRSYSTRRGAGD